MTLVEVVIGGGEVLEVYDIDSITLERRCLLPYTVTDTDNLDEDELEELDDNDGFD